MTNDWTLDLSTQHHHVDKEIDVGFHIAVWFISCGLALVIWVRYSVQQSENSISKYLPPIAPEGFSETVSLLLSDDGPSYLLHNLQRFGSIYRVNMIPGFHCVHCGDGVAAKTLLKGEPYTNLPKATWLLQTLNPIFNNTPTILTTDGSVSMKRRQHIQKTAFRFRAIHDMVEEECLPEIERWLGRLQSHCNRSSTNCVVLDVTKDISELTLRVLSRAAFGYDLSDEETERYIRNMDDATQEYVNRQALNPLRKLTSWMLPDARRARRAVLETRDLAMRIVDNYRRHKEKSSKRKQIILDSIMTCDSYRNDEERLAEILLFLFAGHDTTSHSLAWILLELSRNAKAQEEAFRELQEFPESVSLLERANQSDFIQHVITEGLRLHPVTHVGTVRYTRSEYVVKAKCVDRKYLIPKGSFVWFPPMVAHRDEAYFDNPNEFDPFRWRQSSTSTESLMPFAAGRRQCMGQNLAQMEMRVILAALLERYKLEVVDEGTPRCSFLYKTEGSTIRFVSRTKTSVTHHRTPTHRIKATCAVSRTPERPKMNMDQEQDDSGLIWSFLSPALPGKKKWVTM